MFGAIFKVQVFLHTSRLFYLFVNATGSEIFILNYIIWKNNVIVHT